MEGGWRVAAQVAAVLASCVATVAASGCGDDDSSAVGPAAVRTEDPLRTFAPLIEIAAGEPWRPISARWFIERSSFWLAEDRGCADRKIAVGHTLAEQQNPTIDWIYPKGLGGWSWPAYYRNPYDAKCELIFDRRYYADQLTRPHDPGPRVDGLRPAQGYYLDLVDDARRGPAAAEPPPVYAERTAEGDSSVRLSYWVLFGMHGRPGEPAAHEGDWERIDVVLRADGDRYEPQAVQGTGYANETAWNATRRVDETHPVVNATRATHTMIAAAPGKDCSNCVEWATWKSLSNAPKEPWYGFGGAWGQPGPTDATTGSLGPHGSWPTPAEKRREAEGEPG
jgi:hypothetical protein